MCILANRNFSAQLIENNIYTEKELLIAVAEGNEQAFALLYQQYYNQLSGFLTKFSGSAASAQDILQEAFLRVWLNRDQLPAIDNFNAWIYKVVSRENLTNFKKELRAKTKKSNYAATAELRGDHVLQPKPAEIGEIKMLIARAIDSMPEQRRKIYLLSREKGYKPSEISTLLRISQPTVYNTLSAALKQIREQLAAAGYTIPLSIVVCLKLF